MVFCELFEHFMLEFDDKKKAIKCIFYLKKILFAWMD